VRARSVAWPYRQNDARWAADTMWDRSKVIDVHHKYNGKPIAEAEGLLRRFYRGGNSIGTEGCLITSLAMILASLDEAAWTPRKLNQAAVVLNYYTPAGLSMVALYADLLSDVSNGEVQLCAKEEYLAGERGWEPMFASSSYLLRGFRVLSPSSRRDFAALVKIGTHDDAIASHYLLIDPEAPGSPEADDFRVLDPAQPMSLRTRPWKLSNSYARVAGDRTVRAEWKRRRIQPLQISGVWIFARWRCSEDLLLGGPLFQAALREAAGPKAGSPGAA
jgi:hypothetical protein